MIDGVRQIGKTYIVRHVGRKLFKNFDDFDSLSVLPIEVKSGRDYRVHSAISTFVSNPDYGVREALVLSNERLISRKGAITYLPIYHAQFL